MVLDRYREQASRPDSGNSAETWVALLHRPGTAAPSARSEFGDPLFAQHVAFLSRLRLAGGAPSSRGEHVAVQRLDRDGFDLLTVDADVARVAARVCRHAGNPGKECGNS
jgi:hypothetical protein